MSFHWLELGAHLATGESGQCSLAGPAKYTQLKLRRSLIKRKEGRVEIGSRSWSLYHVARDTCLRTEFEVITLFPSASFSADRCSISCLLDACFTLGFLL